MTKTMKNLALLLICCASCIGFVQAQASPLIYLCIDPTDNASATVPTANDAYLVAFRTTTLVGFISSENASITLYSDPSVTVLGALYHILPDANSGGSRRDGRIASSFTTGGLSSPSACDFALVKDAKLLTDETTLHRSAPFPTSANEALLMKVFPSDYVVPGIDSTVPSNTNAYPEDELDNFPILSNLAFSFLSPLSKYAKSFQFLQLNTEFIDVTFPFLYDSPEDIDFAMISNKEVTMSLSSGEFPDEFTGSRGPKRYVSADKDLATARYNTSLFNILVNSRFSIYPEITIIDYYQSGFVRFEIGDGLPERRNLFVTVADAPNNPQKVKPLDLVGSSAKYYVPDSAYGGDPYGKISSKRDGTEPETRTVVGVDDRGQLLISEGGQTFVIEAWLVEPVQP